MPYINQDDRYILDLDLEHVLPNDAGELNYCITSLLAGYIERKGMRYQYMNDVVGALEGAKAEFQRMVVNPYEDKKIVENGGVYDKEANND